MAWLRRRATIDAAAEIQQRVEGARGPSTVGRGRRKRIPGLRAFVWFVLLAALAVLVFSWWQTVEVEPFEEKTERLREFLPGRLNLPASEPTPPAPSVPPAETTTLPDTSGNYLDDPLLDDKDAPQEPDTEMIELFERVRARQLSAGMNPGSSNVPASSEQGAREIQLDPPDNPDHELARRTRSMPMEVSRAHRITRPELTIVQGSLIPNCLMTTRFVSTQPGMFKCRLQDPVYGGRTKTGGRIVLLDRGTEINGWYDSTTIKQGQERAFLTGAWAMTPDMVRISIDSPTTDGLGATGVAGHYNSQFGRRAWGAVALAFAGDFSQAIANSTRNTNATVSLDGTAGGLGDAATEIIRQSINIPPVVTIEAGKIVSFTVMRDLRFDGVYGYAPIN